jgi:hypothetical protein
VPPRPGLAVGIGLNRLENERLNEPRVTIHHADAFDFAQDHAGPWDWGWHDLWFEEKSLPLQHLRLVRLLRGKVGRQGCWGFDRRTRLLLRHKGLGLLGTPRPMKRAA